MRRLDLCLLALALAGCSLNHRLQPPPAPPPPEPIEIGAEDDGVIEGDPDADLDIASLTPGDGQHPGYQVRVGAVLLDVLQDETTDNERIMVVYLVRELTKAELADASRALRATARYRFLRMFVSFYLPGEIGREPWASAAFAPELVLAIGEELGVAPRPGAPIVWRRYDPEEEDEAISGPLGPSGQQRRPRPRPALNMSRPVHVRAHYRKDGTYVRAHTRRRPRR